jgi:Right handed beta helix region
LTFAHDDWLLNQVGDSHAMAGVQSLALYTRFRADGNWHIDQYDICDLPQATVELRNCKNIRFERNRFVHLGSGTGISLVNDVVDSAVVGNAFNDLAGNAINVGHPQHYVVGGGPLFQGTAGVCARNTVTNNWIRHVSLDFKQGEAISAFFTPALEITHNDIQGVPYGGIALGWWWGNAGIPPSKVPRDNRIAYNRVFDTHQELHEDGGAIYVLGQQPGGRIEGNYVRSAARLLYPDDGSAFWTITGNVLEPQSGPWLFIWTDRIHDLDIDANYTTAANLRNDGHNIQPTRTHVVDTPWPAEAQAIIKAAGLEPAYRNIADVDRAHDVGRPQPIPEPA